MTSRRRQLHSIQPQRATIAALKHRVRPQRSDLERETHEPRVAGQFALRLRCRAWHAFRALEHMEEIGTAPVAGPHRASGNSHAIAGHACAVALSKSEMG